MSESEHRLRIVLVQGGPGPSESQRGIQAHLELLDSAAKSAPDFLVLSELFGLPTFACARDPRYL